MGCFFNTFQEKHGNNAIKRQKVTEYKKSGENKTVLRRENNKSTVIKKI